MFQSHWVCGRLSNIIWLSCCSQVNMGNWKKGENWRGQKEGKKQGGRHWGGIEGSLGRREGKEKESKGENRFVADFYLNLLIHSKACPMDRFLSFSGWALQWNSCVGGISTCDSCFMWEMNLPVMWETVGNEQVSLCCDLTFKSGRIMAHKTLEWEGPERFSWCAGWEITEHDGMLLMLWGLIKLEVVSQELPSTLECKLMLLGLQPAWGGCYTDNVTLASHFEQGVCPTFLHTSLHPPRRKLSTWFFWLPQSHWILLKIRLLKSARQNSAHLTYIWLNKRV